MLKCIKCQYEWFERSDTPPKRCPNPPCRSMLWAAKEETKEEKLEFMRALMAQPKPLVIEVKKDDFDGLDYKYETDI